MTRWTEVPLHDICRPKQWPTIQQTEFTETGYPVYGANGKIGFYSEYNHEEPTILITCRGATCGTINVCEPKSYVTGNAMSLDDLEERAHLGFVVQALRYRGVAKAITGTAQPQITRQSLSAVTLPLPPLLEQRHIAAILDKADALLAKRRAALEQLNSLTQSIFLEMFGDPATNPHNLPQEQLASLCSSPDDIKCGPFGTQLSRSEYTDDGVPLWGIKHVNAFFTFPTREYVAPRTAQRLIQYSIQPGDIVMTRKGTVGNCAVYPDNLPLGIMHSDLLRLRVSRNKCDPLFLAHQLHNSRDVETQLGLISGGAVMPGVNVTKLKTLRVLAAPLPQQQEFARRVVAVEALETVLRSSFGEFATLFASLQNQAFSGAL